MISKEPKSDKFALTRMDEKSENLLDEKLNSLSHFNHQTSEDEICTMDDLLI